MNKVRPKTDALRPFLNAIDELKSKLTIQKK